MDNLNAVERFGWRFQVRDKVIQTENNYKKEVFNGDIGMIEKIDPVEQEVSIMFDDKLVVYDYGELDEVSLAYAVTIHKAQGSEFPVVVIPVAMQHFMLLQRNLIYTGITRAKRLLVVVGQKKALGLAIRNDQARKRYSGRLRNSLSALCTTDSPASSVPVKFVSWRKNASRQVWPSRPRSLSTSSVTSTSSASR